VLRKNFIRLSGASLGSLLLPSLIKAQGKKEQTISLPDSVSAQTNAGWFTLKPTNQESWQYEDVVVGIKPEGNFLPVTILSPVSALNAIRLSWKYPLSKNAVLLGDHWERSYGDLAWKQVSQAAKMPWYFIQHDKGDTICFGVKTGCQAICYWQLEGDTLNLTLDTRSGGEGVQAGNRMIQAAGIVTAKNDNGENAYATARRFCKLMCEAPRPVSKPVYGINDWYFAYGNNSAELILQHTSMLAPLVTDSSNKPFSVIDAGWAVKSPLLPDDCCWGDGFSAPNDKFRDMGKLAGEIKKIGMHPGLWVRPLCAKHDDKQNLLMPPIKNRDDPKYRFLDPTIEENLETVKNYLRTYKDWGYEMVKHDYTTYDILGKWGFEMTESLTQSGWHFNDNTKTNAEIIGQLYRSIRQSAGDMYIIGCNTISHLSAGLFELNRIGDDTSGNEWDRTRKMGVNTLGFRMIQHKNFYEADGDCVGLTNKVPWSKNKQWMQLLAQSSAPLFISAQPDAVGEEQKQFIKESFAQAARPQPVAEPLDWLTNPLPSQWKLNGNKVSFDWN
jgi:alpha-galactosidase